MPVNPTLPTPGTPDVWGATINTAISAVAAGVNAEETARAAADAALDGRVDAIEGVQPTFVTSSDIDSVVQLTQVAYDALATKDARTLYVIVG